MYILGISAYYHDSAAALIKDGEILAAAQEERFSRKKQDDSFPSQSIQYCLKEAGISLEDIEYIAFYDKPFIKFERLLKTYLAEAPLGFQSFITSVPLWLKEKIFLKKKIIQECSDIAINNMQFSSKKEEKKASKIYKKNIEQKILFSEHHQSHAASAFYPSSFEEAAILTIDGVGEWTTTSIAYGKGKHIEFLEEIHFPHSLGLLYSAFTYFCGFKVNSGEYKLMGLAPYGTPKYTQLIKDHLIDIKNDGSFRLNMKYFNFSTGLTMTNKKFAQLFNIPVRESESELTQIHMDIAASIQEVTEEVMIKLAHHAQKITGSKNLCMAGGVALNCVANGKILKEKIFENIWIQPAAGDAGGAIGSALATYHEELKHPRKIAAEKYDQMKGSYLGPSFSDKEIEAQLTEMEANFHKVSDDKLFKSISTALAEEKVIGWHQGRMEFGPRALGNRSIIGDARSPKMQSIMNLKIKYRESFRPFAPSVLRENVQEYFDINTDSPYMLLVAPVQENIRTAMTAEQENLFGIEKLHIPRSTIPAVTHIDYSARVQTVHKETNPRYHELIKHFEEKTGCATIVNTSFNVRGEPIVCSPKDSFRCFMRTEMDILVIGNYILYKKEQKDFKDTENWKETFELD